jgi:hypothetical protein
VSRRNSESPTVSAPTRAFVVLGAVAVVLAGLGSVATLVAGGLDRALVVAAALVVVCVGVVVGYGVRRARQTETPYWRT